MAAEANVSLKIPPIPVVLITRNVQELPARRSCAVLSGANEVSESGNSFVK
jgi:hypothetical protein